MRLTFRRLLAYLDGVLNEEDVQVVGQKISESKVASQLIHRIRNAKTRDRLGAPRVFGAGMGLDPNTVAEYLDYTLDEERVADFETVCFESDVHLAEVSASHEILTIVLAEPAQVERSIRERIYGIPQEMREGRHARQRQDQAGAAADVEATSESQPERIAINVSAAAASSQPSQEADAMREMAEYLGERNEVRWRSLLLTAALSFALVLVGLRAVGRFDESHPLLGRMLASNSNADTASPDTAPVIQQEGLQSPGAGETPAADEAAVDPDENAEADEDAEADEASQASEGAVEPADENPGAAASATEPQRQDPLPPVAPLGSPDDAETNPAPAATADGPPRVPAPPIEDAAAADVDNAAQPADAADAADAAAEGGPDASTLPAPPLSSPLQGSPDGAPPLIAAGEDPAPAPAAGGDVPAPKTEVGLYNTPKQVLSRYRAEDKSWRRLASRDVIRVGDRLRVLPFYRPQVAFAGSLQMTIVGPADVKVLPPVDGKPHIQLLFGKVIVETVATADVSAMLELGPQQGELLLKSLDSAVAVSFDGFLPVGQDPQEMPQVAALWCGLRGESLWSPAGDDSVVGIPLPIGQRLTAVNDVLATPIKGPPPAWVEPPATDALTLAAEDAEKEFSPNRALSLTLEELLNHRMVNVRSAATQSLAHFGNFLPFVQSLKAGNREDNPDYFYRQAEFAAMRHALARGGPAPASLRRALEREFEGQSATIERIWMLCRGFDNAQLQRGQSAQLIQDLSSEVQAVRLLALENLRRITGKMKAYNPLKDPETQKPGIAAWSKLLEADEIRWDPPPGPFPTGVNGR